MPDRRRRPPIHPIQGIKLPPIEVIHLDNGIPVYVINQGTQPVLKLELVFDAGRPFEHKNLAGKVTAALLREGSQNYNAFQIADRMDFYGSSLKVPFDMDTSSVILYTLNKHFSQVFPILMDLLLRPDFSTESLNQYVQRAIRKLEVEAAKPEVRSYRIITEKIFGEDHPYGYNSTPERYLALRREDLVDHFTHFFQARTCKVFISGKVEPNILAQLRAGLEQLPDRGPVSPQLGPALPAHPQKLRFLQEGSVQTAIRIGLPLFRRSHPDYADLYFLNTLLGGYFGSRLMSNIREDKGYTYHINSSLDCMRYDGCWLISTETSPAYEAATRDEILREVDRLHRDLVKSQEIEMVGNYIHGVLLSMLDGPFQIAEAVKNLVSEEADLNFFEHMAGLCRQITPEQLRQLSRKYLDPGQFVEVCVGPKLPE